jgi:hypothetical protein
VESEKDVIETPKHHERVDQDDTSTSNGGEKTVNHLILQQGAGERETEYKKSLFGGRTEEKTT